MAVGIPVDFKVMGVVVAISQVVAVGSASFLPPSVVNGIVTYLQKKAGS